MTSFRKFWKYSSGVIATEFALVAPVLVVLWIGIVEASSAHLVARKVEVAAQSAADLIAQDPDITNDQVMDIAEAIKLILNPYPDTTVPTTAGYNFASVESDSDGANTVVWSRAGGTRVVGDPSVAVAATLNTTDDSVIVATIEYAHTPVLFSALFGASIATFTITETAYARPRLIAKIPDPP